MTTQTTGRFVWHELHTTDRAKATTFYAQLFSWQTKEITMEPGDPYVLCQLGGKDHAGITRSKAPANVPSHWIPYLAVDDVDKSAAKVKELGGSLLMEPMDIPNVGRFVAVKDPQGAAFALYKGANPYPEEPASPPVGAFCWEELMTTDPAAAAKFYAGLFGYAIEEKDMGPMGTYRILKRGDRQTAGIMNLPPGAPPRSAWLEYVHVADVDGSLRNAVEIGAKQLMPAMDIPNIGRFAVLADPTGAPVAVFKGA